MKKLFILLIALCFSLFACVTANPTKTYIDIQQADKIYEFGKFKYAVNPGDKLEVVRSKLCRGGSGECWEVRNVRTGEIGYTRVDRMKASHRIYKTTSLAFQNEPDSFRGNKWGSRLETFGELEKLDDEYPIYKKVDEELTMGGVQVESIVYFFKNDQFNMAQVVFNSEKNFKKLRKVLESRYGKGVKGNYLDPSGDKFYEANVGRKSPERNRYWWVNKQHKLSLYIEYIENDKKGQIYYFHELSDKKQS